MVVGFGPKYEGEIHRNYICKMSCKGYNEPGKGLVVWQKVGIVYKGNARSLALADQVVELLTGRGLTCWRTSSSARGVVGLEPPCPDDFYPDLILSLGGDGTLLYAAQRWGLTGIPILGVNLGFMGFLAEIEPSQLESLLEDILANRYQVERRLALEVTVTRHGQVVGETVALNEITVHKGVLSRIMTLGVSVRDFGHWSFRADGIIISTPTGSTAYNLSAGGPVVYPTIDAILITPICPFTLSSRPIVLPADFPVEVVVDSPVQDIHLTADGQMGWALQAGDLVTARCHPVGISLIVNPHRTFIEVLRQKLNWA